MLSSAAIAVDCYKKLAGSCLNDIKRDDVYFVKTVEDLGDAANGAYSKLKIVEIPDNVDFIIEEYDGIEWVSEKHRTWS